MPCRPRRRSEESRRQSLSLRAPERFHRSPVNGADSILAKALRESAHLSRSERRLSEMEFDGMYRSALFISLSMATVAHAQITFEKPQTKLGVVKAVGAV